MRAEARESNDSYWSNLWEGGRERVDREEQRAGEAGRTVRFGFLHLLFLLLRGLAFSICFLVTPSFISEPTLDQKLVIQNKLTLRLWSFFDNDFSLIISFTESHPTTSSVGGEKVFCR